MKNIKTCICEKFPLSFNNQLYEFIREEKRINNASIAARLINLWKPGRQLKVYFSIFNENPKIIDEILLVANEWSKHCSIHFVLEKQKEIADIYVSLKSGYGFYSAIGLQSKVYISKNQPSMNLDPSCGLKFGFSKRKELIFKYCKSLILHEFGHALGLIHEHQRSNRPFTWDKRYIKENYLKLGMPTFKIAKENILKICNVNNMVKSRFDYKSIMIYPFDKKMVKEKFGIPIPLELSKSDKIKISKIYP